MAEYRKKPVVIEAIQIEEIVSAVNHENEASLPPWVQAAIATRQILFVADGILVSTAEGPMLGDHADWLIKGIIGELYPCKPDVFAGTYEVV